MHMFKYLDPYQRGFLGYKQGRACQNNVVPKQWSSSK